MLIFSIITSKYFLKNYTKSHALTAQILHVYQFITPVFNSINFRNRQACFFNFHNGRSVIIYSFHKDPKTRKGKQ